MSIRQDKADLRKQARERRSALAEAVGPAAAETLAELLLPRLRRLAPQAVGGYWPLEDEIDPRPLLERLAGEGLELSLPCLEECASPLVFRRWRPGDSLRPGAFGVMEPERSAEILRPDLLLVPLLAFDRAGYRLGFGGGYYDRTIAALASESQKLRRVGLAFAGQEVDHVPREAHDAPLDLVVTEAGPIRTQAAGEVRRDEESI